MGQEARLASSAATGRERPRKGNERERLRKRCRSISPSAACPPPHAIGAPSSALQPCTAFSPPRPSMSFELPCPVADLQRLFPNASGSNSGLAVWRLGRTLRTAVTKSLKDGNDVAGQAPSSSLLSDASSSSSLPLFDFLEPDNGSTSDEVGRGCNDSSSGLAASTTSIADQLTILWIPSLRDIANEAAGVGGSTRAKNTSALSCVPQKGPTAAIQKERRAFSEWLHAIVDDISDQYLQGVQSSKLFGCQAHNTPGGGGGDDDDAAVAGDCGKHEYAMVIALLASRASEHAPLGLFPHHVGDLPTASSANRRTAAADVQRYVVGICVGKELAEARRAETEAEGEKIPRATSATTVSEPTTPQHLNDTLSSQWASSTTRLSDAALRGSSVCGVELMWVLEPLRRCGIATVLVHELRKHLVYGGFEIPPHAVAFSQPTRDGKQFAAAFAGRKDFFTFV